MADRTFGPLYCKQIRLLACDTGCEMIRRNLPTPIAFRTLSIRRRKAMNTAMKLAAIPLATGALWGFSSLGASARVVCNADGDCWHIQEDYAYPPAAGIIIHPDDW